MPRKKTSALPRRGREPDSRLLLFGSLATCFPGWRGVASRLTIKGYRDESADALGGSTIIQACSRVDFGFCYNQLGSICALLVWIDL